MSMKFGRAYCEEFGTLVSPYRARELYTDEGSDHYGEELRFYCEDPNCRVQLTPVGIYMIRRSKRALHFRSNREHKPSCGFVRSGVDDNVRKATQHEDDYKLTNFPTELDLNPPKHKSSSGSNSDGDAEEASGGLNGSHNGGNRRKTNSRTRYLDLVVDCFLSGDEQGMKGKLTIAGKTKLFPRFFKKVPYFEDETGLIYYGPIDELKIYSNGKGIGLRFADSVRMEKRSYRIWLHISQEVIEGSSRKKSFLAEIAELKKAVDAKEDVNAFFTGAYPERTTVEAQGGKTFDLYRAELSSINHLSLTFSKIGQGEK